MALLSVKKEGKMKLTPKSVKERLFYFADCAEHYHLETKSFAEHKALDGLYEGMADFRDDILEKLMGYMGGDRIGSFSIEPMPEYSDKKVKELVVEIQEFAYNLKEWAESKKFCDLENIADSVSGLSAKTMYLLTLK